MILWEIAEPLRLRRSAASEKVDAYAMIVFGQLRKEVFPILAAGAYAVQEYDYR